MANLQQTLAFTIQGGGVGNINSWIGIGYPVTGTTLTPKTTEAALPGEFKGNQAGSGLRFCDSRAAGPRLFNNTTVASGRE